MGQSRSPSRFRLRCLSVWIAGVLASPQFAEALSFGGDVGATSDYIFRGISQSRGNPATQLDLHASIATGTFAGVFASTLGTTQGRNSAYEAEAYLGHRFNLSPSWSTTVSAINYAYVHWGTPFSNDYQELSASVSYLDAWTLSLSASPNAVRYAQRYRVGRYPAYVADASGQVPLVGRLSFTLGVGYYSLTGPEGDGYVYGNAGLAFEYKALRIDAGYYAVGERAQYLFPYARVGDRFAGTLSWHF